MVFNRLEDSRDALRLFEHLLRRLLLLATVPLDEVVVELRPLTPLQVGADDVHTETREVIIVSFGSDRTVDTLPREERVQLLFREPRKNLVRRDPVVERHTVEELYLVTPC